MVAFVMFWAALFAMCFFVAGTLFKALASALHALLNFAVSMVAYIVFLVLLALVSAALYEIVNAILDGSISALLPSIVLTLVGGAILVGLFGGLGTLILGVIAGIIELVSQVVSTVLEGMAAICEKGYAKALNMIVKRIERC